MYHNTHTRRASSRAGESQVRVPVPSELRQPPPQGVRQEGAPDAGVRRSSRSRRCPGYACNEVSSRGSIFAGWWLRVRAGMIGDLVFLVQILLCPPFHSRSLSAFKQMTKKTHKSRLRVSYIFHHPITPRRVLSHLRLQYMVEVNKQ